MPHARVHSIAASPLLLVATDFDGTISPLVPTPSDARGEDRCLAALARLSRLPCTAVAVISGRPLAWLREATSSIPDVLLFGSHGAEDGTATRVEADPHTDPTTNHLTDPHVDLKADPQVATLARELDVLAARWSGCLVERKPLAAALHYRRVDPRHENEIVAAAQEVAVLFPGVFVRIGSKVVELCVSERNKGDAVRRAAYASGATHTIFLGDDVTDEDAFKALSPHDLPIKIGSGESTATVRIAGIAEVAGVLEQLAERRERWLAERLMTPIQNHAVLSDQRTIALVAPGGGGGGGGGGGVGARVTWLCLPRIDSAALFADLLGGPKAGHFTIEAEDGSPPVAHEYLPDSMLLRTRWSTFQVTDYLDCSGGRAFQRAGRSDLVRVLEGQGRTRIIFAPRHDFARTATTLVAQDGGLEVGAGGEPCVLYAPGVQWRITDDGPHQTAEAIVDLGAMGGTLTLELRFGTGNLRPSTVPEPDRREQTRRHWAGWAASLKLPPHPHPPQAKPHPQHPHRDLLVRSALTIRALCNGPGGAIAAAGTTSLPEQIGGVRNWDYRFCWPRDAALAATALLRLGNTGHAMKLTDWLVGIVDRLESPERLRPIYAMRGEDLGAEAEIGSLPGYGDSRPVRVGNAAAHQVQLDVFGPIVHMVASMTERGVAVSPDAWRLVRAMVRAVESRWEEPDHGIWEIRGPRRHHVHSKVMCWHAVDRALVVHDAVLGRDNAEWRSLRDRIADDVLAKGWNERARAFTGSYGSGELDAASLAVGLCGLLPHADPRWHATVAAIDTHLRRGATVYRYRGDDGLPGTEGGFVICATWLVEALVTVGRTDDARALFNEIAAQTGPTGLLAEQWDPIHHIALGNVPQAYSHLGVINAALALSLSPPI